LLQYLFTFFNVNCSLFVRVSSQCMLTANVNKYNLFILTNVLVNVETDIN